LFKCIIIITSTVSTGDKSNRLETQAAAWDAFRHHHRHLAIPSPHQITAQKRKTAIISICTTTISICTTTTIPLPLLLHLTSVALFGFRDTTARTFPWLRLDFNILGFF
jgi:hypothetical protein